MTSRAWLKFSVGLALLFALGLGVEAFLNLKGRTFCELESCLIVGEFARLSHQDMVFLGLGYFGLFSLLGLLVLKGWKLEGLWVGLASSGLFAETVFILRQAFDYVLWCPFCVGVAFGVISSGLPVLWFFRSRMATLAGGLLGLTLAFYLTGVPLKPLEKTAFSAFPERPATSGLILIYSSECPHCHEVLKFCRNLPSANLKLCPLEKAKGLLRLLDLKGVPVLVVKEPPRIKILEGSEAIIAYLKGKFSGPGKALESLSPGAAEMPGLLIPQTGGVCSELQPKCQ